MNSLWVPITITEEELTPSTASIIRKCNRELVWFTSFAFLTGISVGAALASALS